MLEGPRALLCRQRQFAGKCRATPSIARRLLQRLRHVPPNSCACPRHQRGVPDGDGAVSYTHLRAHETSAHL
eukprot:6280027-Alexandrium_andersonii.AAC.1